VHTNLCLGLLRYSVSVDDGEGRCRREEFFSHSCRQMGRESLKRVTVIGRPISDK
jgi:hypothetical protein